MANMQWGVKLQVSSFKLDHVSILEENNGRFIFCVVPLPIWKNGQCIWKLPLVVMKYYLFFCHNDSL